MPATTFSSLGSESAAASVAGSSAPEHLTLAVLGCGAMGIALLSGILTELAERDAPRPLQVASSSSCSLASMAVHAKNGRASPAAAAAAGGASGPGMDTPDRLPTHFLACVRRPEAAKRVRAALWAHSSVVKVVVDDNVAAVQQAGVVLLACQPADAPALLAAPGLAQALQGTLLVSICGGLSTEQIRKHLYAGGEVDRPTCCIVRAVPNAAALVGESMTVVDTTTQPAAPGHPSQLPAEAVALVTWLFRRIGDVTTATTAATGIGAGASAAAATALSTASPAFFALVLEAAVDGAVAAGLPRAEAQHMAAQAMRGAAGLVLHHGEHPALLRERIATPGSAAVPGLLALEESGVRSAVARAVRAATAHEMP